MLGWDGLAWLGRSWLGWACWIGWVDWRYGWQTAPNGASPRTLGRSYASIQPNTTQNLPSVHTRLGWAGWAGCERLHWLDWLGGEFLQGTIQELPWITIWAGLAAGWAAAPVMIKRLSTRAGFAYWLTTRLHFVMIRCYIF